MKKMHKIGAGILAVSMMVTAMALPAMAEDGQSVGSAAVAAVTARGGRPGSQMPGGNNQRGQMPGNGNNQQGQMPGNGNNQQDQMPGNGNNQQGQMPGNGNNQQGQMPGNPPEMKGNQNQAPQKTQTDAQTGTEQAPETQTTEGQNQQQAPQAPDGKAPMDGSQMPGHMGPMNGQAPDHVDFKALVENGVIDEDTLTKIEEYIKQNAPAMPGMPADGQAPADGQTPPEKPEGDLAPAQGEQPEKDDLLAKLVEAGILTQEQADAIESLTQAAAETDTATSENT